MLFVSQAAVECGVDHSWILYPVPTSAIPIAHTIDYISFASYRKFTFFPRIFHSNVFLKTQMCVQKIKFSHLSVRVVFRSLQLSFH